MGCARKNPIFFWNNILLEKKRKEIGLPIMIKKSNSINFAEKESTVMEEIGFFCCHYRKKIQTYKNPTDLAKDGHFKDPNTPFSLLLVSLTT